MLKFSVPSEPREKTPIAMTLSLDPDGDVALMANGIPVLWVGTSGLIMPSMASPTVLSQMGFMMDGKRVSIRL